MTAFDQDALIAAVDLAGRSGARQIEIGYVHDDVPMERAGWYAKALFRGAVLFEESVGPIEAAEALARRLLDGATCAHCHRPVSLADDVAGCRWTRQARRWVRACETPEERSSSHG